MSKRPLFTEIRRHERANELRHEAVVGVVVDNKDPDKLGRVKVKFPTISEDASHWAPISSLGAGKDRGWWFLPELDDEVLVMFAHGDLARPVVIGALWNGVDAPPDTNGGGNERRTIVSRSGHKVVFDDDGGKIEFTDGDGLAKVEMTADKITIETSGDAEFFAPAGELNVKAKEIKMEAQTKMVVDANAVIKMSADSNFNLKGGSMLQINGAVIQIKPGGTPAAGSVSSSPESVPDPVGD